MITIRHIFGGALAFFCLAQIQSMATQMIPLSVEELSKKARLVLQGTVMSKTIQRDAENRIYTKVELLVNETWKGGPLRSHSFTIIQAGGILGEEAAGVEGQEEFWIGEEAVVFLVMNARGEGVVLGLSQGKFKVWKDTASGQKYAHNLFHGAGPGKQDKPDRKALSLAELKQQVQGGRP